MAKVEKRDPKTAPSRAAQDSATPVLSGPPPSSGTLILQWFLSGTVRHATAMRKHVQKLLNHQRDVLTPQATGAVEGGIQELQAAVAGGSDKAALEKQMQRLEETANKWLKPYPN